MKSKRFLSLVLAVLMVLSCGVTATVATASAADTDTAKAENDYNLGNSVNDGVILQAWNWSYSEIKKNLEQIAQAGFTTIQISPPTELKEATVGVKVLQKTNDNGWWMMYQPAAYELNNSEDNVLGTKDELIDMIDAAHDMGLYVIADAVINHLGNAETADYKINANTLPKDANAVDYLCKRAWDFESSRAIINEGAFHYPYANCVYNDTGAFDCTQNAVSLLPDLDTSKPIVQETILDYWHECIDAGIDGFRIDAAKHIETKYDGAYASDFWDVLMYDGINGKEGIYPYAKNTYGKDLYMYGEILNTVSTERSFSWYLEYMNITNSTAFYAICDAVNNGTPRNAVPKSFNNGMTSKTAVLWDESHDTYMDGCKEGRVPSTALLTKRWACMASRADVVSMYLARPTNTPNEVYSLDLGVAYDTAWNDKETAQINKFHNHFQGSTESVSSYGKFAIIERADSGVVLVNCKGTNITANVPVNSLADGTYIDQMTGNTFTCKDGQLTGNVGETGVAVVYNPSTPVVTATKESCNFTGDSISVDIVANGYNAEIEVKGTLGDADGDTFVNVKDATLIQKYAAELTSIDGNNLFCANVTGDAIDDVPVVNVKDATAIQKYAAMLETGFDIGGPCQVEHKKPIGAMYSINNGDKIDFTGKVSLELDEFVDGAVNLKLYSPLGTKSYTYRQISEDSAAWVKYDNSETKWSKVYCYVFTDAGVENNVWPGLLMTERENDIWYYEIPDELRGATVIFSDNILGTGQQTGNLSMTVGYGTDHFIYTNGVWSAIDENGDYHEIQETKSGYYIVFTDVNNWKASVTSTKSKICCYAWGGGPAMSWPGITMDYIGQNDQGQNQYATWIDRGYTNIIFNCTSVSKQTADLLVYGNCGYYPLSAESKPDCGTFEVTPPAE